MIIGGKAASLIKLKKNGINVPRFTVCNSKILKDSLDKLILEKFPDVKYFAVRSSSENEDSKKKSLAGFFYSALGVGKERIYEEIVKVASSYKGGKGSIIIQEFIPSDIAGVIFTKTLDSKIIINSTLGLCTSVVNGKLSDEYILDTNGKLLNKKTPIRKPIEVFQKNKIVSKKTDNISLDIKKLKKVIKEGLRIQKLFKAPQDIEWCFYRNNLFILQSRPITKNFNAFKQEIFYDSANIAESYSGIVSPLTFTFARMVYSRVYRDLLNKSGVSLKKLRSHSEIFDNLLGLFYGRMYYNINNWYLLAAFLPGYRRNKENFELMITSNIKEDIDTSIKPSIYLKTIYPLILLIKILFYKMTAAKFKKQVEIEHKKFHKMDFDKMKIEDCIKSFNHVNNNLLNKWYITVENDFMVMTFLGLIKKRVGEKKMQKIINFKSKATEQVAELAKLSKIFKKNKSLWDTVEKEDDLNFKKLIKKNIEIKKAFDNYLLTFGGRFANELKLETIGIDEDLNKFFNVLKAYNNYQVKSQSNNNSGIKMNLITKIILGQFKNYASQREEFRLLRSNTFGITRKIFRRIGYILTDEKRINKVDDIFFLNLQEILNSKFLKTSNLKKIIKVRKNEYKDFGKINPPSHFSIIDDNVPSFENDKKNSIDALSGTPASSGKASGEIKIFKEFSISPLNKFDILVTSHTDPGWTSLIALSKGLIIEHGGLLSHASIVARELNIPAIIGVKGAMTILKDHQEVKMDGSTGYIKVIKNGS